MPDFQHAKDLRERRAEIAKQMADLTRKAHEEDRALNGEERQQFDKMSVDCDSLLQRAEDLEKVEKLQVSLKEPVGIEQDGQYRLDTGEIVSRRPADQDRVVTQMDVQLAIRAWGMGELATNEMRVAADKCQFKPGRELHLRLADSYEYQKMRRNFRENGILYRATTAQSVGTNAKGGHTVDTEVVRRIEEAMLAFGGMRDVATVIRTAQGGNLIHPTADDTTTAAAILSENTCETTSDLTFGAVTYRAHMYSSKLVKSSIQLLQDTAVDLVGFIGSAIGTRLARGTNRDYTTGSTATTSPRGILVDTVQGFAATTTSGDISLTSLTELLHSVDPEYRQPGAGWMMNDGIVKEVRQVVDSQGNPIWQIGMQTGTPDRLLGFPITVNNRMVASTTGAGQKTVIFGQLDKYVIRDVLDMNILRMDERFADCLQVAWLGFLRTDGALLVASTRNASKPVKHLKGTT